MIDRQKTLSAFERLLDIMNDLREKCPWDKKQTFESLRHLTIEEVYELGDAIIQNNLEEVGKELGDLLLHVVFYAKLGNEAGAFTMETVLNGICDKLVYRHPHIYGDVSVENEDDVKKNWEQLKLQEKKNKRVLDGVPKNLPALVKAVRIQSKARGAGFDWEKKEDVWDKVKEELTELKAEVDAGDADRMENELGDYLFSLLNMARLYGIDPETALEKTNLKFINRFNYIEQRIIDQGGNINDKSLQELDILWEEAKSKVG